MKTIIEQIVKHYPSPLEVKKLKERIENDKFMSLSKLAKRMGITYVTLWRKLNNEKGFFLYDLEREYLEREGWLTIETEERMSKLNKE